MNCHPSLRMTIFKWVFTSAICSGLPWSMEDLVTLWESYEQLRAEERRSEQYS